MINLRRRYWSHLPLLLIVIVATALSFSRIGQLVENQSIIRRWLNQDEQYRLMLGEIPYDALVKADAVLPDESTILLVTSGEDVRHLEYTTYHRALYFLAPRSVWWISPAQPDGTWESRWWQYSPMTEEAIQDVVRTKEVDCILTVDVTLPEGSGTQIGQWGEVSLWQPLSRAQNCSGPETGRLTSVMDVSPMWLLGLLLAVAIIMALGSGVLAIAGLWGFRMHPLEAAALTWVLGAGLLTVLMLWLNALGLSLGGSVSVVTALATVSFLSYWRWRSRNSDQTSRISQAPAVARHWPSNAVNLFLMLLLAFNVIFVLLMVSGRPLSVWDSWVNWAMKARIIFLESAITPAVYADPSRAVALLDYPLSIPLLEAWLFRWLGVADDRLVGLLFWLCYLSLPLIVYGAGRRWGASKTRALLAAVAVATMGVMVGLAAAAFTDLFLAVLAVIATIYLVDWLNGSSPGALLISALAAGLLPWIKREGWILLAVLCLATIIMTARSRRSGRELLRWRRTVTAIAAFLIAALVLAGPWWYFASQRAIASGNFLPVSLVNLLSNVGRLPTIGRLMTTQLIQPEFGYVWPLALIIGLAIIFLRTRIGLSGTVLILPVTAFMYLCLMGLTYVYSDYVPYQQHVLTSFFRLGGQVAPLIVIWLAYGIFPAGERGIAEGWGA